MQPRQSLIAEFRQKLAACYHAG